MFLRRSESIRVLQAVPVIIEYKRAISENVINQGLFYLDWLNDHQADFRWLVMEKLGKAVAESID